jgi:hypothetical protein
MRSARVDTIPATLRHLPQWVLWKYEAKPDKPDKVPYTPRGWKASVENPKTVLDAYRRVGSPEEVFALKGVLITDITQRDRPLLASTEPEVLSAVFDAIRQLLDRWEAQARYDYEAERLRKLVEEDSDADR